MTILLFQSFQVAAAMALLSQAKSPSLIITEPLRILLIIFVAGCSHFIVIMVKHLGYLISTKYKSKTSPKIISLSSLGTSILIFIIYFSAFGFILHEFGLSLKTYLASASVIGLAVGFGSQGLVQDVVMGLTLVLSGLIDIDDMVEISGQTGIVKSISMRFVVLENSLGAQVFIPNRSITNVVNYPRGYIRCIVDVQLKSETEINTRIENNLKEAITSFFEQFPGILVAPPSLEGKRKTSTGKNFLRVKFRIWPGRGTPIETTFKQELLYSIKTINPDYQEWMVSVFYEVEKIVKLER